MKPRLVHNADKLPHTIDAEQGLLGSVLNHYKSYGDVAHILKPEMFFEQYHRKMWSVIEKLSSENRPFNPITIKSMLPELERDGKDIKNEYLARLAAEAVPVSMAVSLAHAIQEHYLRRELVEVGQAIMTFAQDIDVSIGANIKQSLQELSHIQSQNDSQRKHTQFGDVLSDAARRS